MNELILYFFYKQVLGYIMQSYSYLFIKGFLTGCTIAAIGGPVALLCIRQSLAKGRSVGVAIGIGAGLGDALFGGIAVFGITIISNFLLQYQIVLKFVGSGLLFFLGISALKNSPKPFSKEVIKKSSYAKSLITSFFLTISNPATILFFAAISLNLGVGLGDYLAASLMVIGIFIGTVFWFSLLATITSYFQLKITAKKMLTVTRFFGIALICFAATMAIQSYINISN